MQEHCKYLTADYLEFLKDFRLRPREQVFTTFTPVGEDTGSDSDVGDVHMEIKGTWSDTILYEIPILALTSEAYFRFIDTDWNYEGQEEQAFQKGLRLLEAGCTTSEFGTRRRRDYHTQALVFRGLVKASKEAAAKGFPGKLTGTSNVHLAMRFGIPPVGTVAHEWFMGIAAITNDYTKATEEALRHWVSSFGPNLAIALTDTFGTQEFLRAFSLPIRPVDGGFSPEVFQKADGSMKTYAEMFTGVRQDSGDPAEYVKMLRDYYDAQGITDKKVIVFSDSLNIDSCLEYLQISQKYGFQPSFGVGTFLTNDFTHLTTGTKSVPLNIVIKLSSAAGRPAVKIRLVTCSSSTKSAQYSSLANEYQNLKTVTILERTLVTRRRFKKSSSRLAMLSGNGRMATRLLDGAGRKMSKHRTVKGKPIYSTGYLERRQVCFFGNKLRLSMSCQSLGNAFSYSPCSLYTL